jgi:hypothetical protein
VCPPPGIKVCLYDLTFFLFKQDHPELDADLESVEQLAKKLLQKDFVGFMWFFIV